MMSNKQSLLLLCAIVTAMSYMYFAGRPGAGLADYPGQFPDFELETVSNAGRSVTAESFSSRPALVNVWASWCLACRTEHALLMELAESRSIAIYGVNYLDDRDDAIRWLDYFGDPFEMSVYDYDGRFGGALGAEVVPATYLVGSSGRILYGHVGPLNEEVLEDEIWPRVGATEVSMK